MIVVSSAELRNNMKKYLDIANDEQVIIQRGRTETYVLLRQSKVETGGDLARAITSKKLLEGIRTDIREMFKK
jgi:prevent-host-death family protein